MSFVFELEAYWENGQAAQAKASAAPSCAPPNRLPANQRPTMQIRSQRIEVACTAGSVSHFPLQPKT